MKEREVKLSAPDGFELPDLSGMRAVAVTLRTEQLLSTLYLDSDDHRLARWGLSFRHRAGQGWTVKLPSDDAGALLVRDEIVFKSRAGTPPAAAADLVRGYLRREPLRPQVRLRTHRRGILLHDAQGRLLADVVDDAASVLDGPLGGSAFRELEVETTEDTPAGLLEAIVKRLRAAGAGAPDPTPKYLRAIGGASAAPPAVQCGFRAECRSPSKALGGPSHFSIGTEAATWRRLCPGSDKSSAPVPEGLCRSSRWPLLLLVKAGVTVVATACSAEQSDRRRPTGLLRSWIC